MPIVLFIICLILSLFILYMLVRHDFVLARKSLLLQEIFDTTFFAYLSFLVFGRISYILGEEKFGYFQFIKFFHLIRFPGVLFIGGIAGFGLIIYFIFRKKKILARIFDIYSIALYPIFLFALLTSSQTGYFIYFNIMIFLLSAIFLGLGIYSYKNYTLKDGTVAYLFVCLVSIFTIVSEFTQSSRPIFTFFTIPQVFAIGIFLTSSVLLLIHEGMLSNK